MNIPSAHQLAGRDPARAALLGALAPMGARARMGHEPSARQSVDAWMGQGARFGNDPRFGGYPGQYQQQHRFGGDPAQGREHELYPNAGSDAKIQKYAFALNQTVTQQTAVAIAASQNPSTQIRPKRLTCNAPAEGWGTFTNLQLANVNVFVGGTLDMFDFSARAQDAAMDLPTLSPANAVQVAGAYSGFLAPGYVAGAPFIWALSLKGPSNMVA